MRVEATPEAEATIREIRRLRRGQLTITIGTGCCESTAPFLYEDYVPGPDASPVGYVAGVEILASEWLRGLYAADVLILDVTEDPAGDSFSIETELGRRLSLRHPEQAPARAAQAPASSGASSPSRRDAAAGGESPDRERPSTPPPSSQGRRRL